jgi:cyanophycinase
MTRKPKGQLMIIGGHEREGDLSILDEVVKIANRRSGDLLIITVASQEPEEQTEEYMQLFKNRGAKRIDALDIRQRSEAQDEKAVKKCQEAAVIFFTGGDQLRITSQIGDSPLFQCLHDNYWNGGTIAGTSAGAAAMPETMLISGESDKSDISALGMAPGLGLIEGLVIDTHFAERGRIGRLLGAVAQNPRNLGIGIDEDTAICVRDDHFIVMGAGAVYVVDGSRLTYSSLSEERPEGVVSIYDITVHVLAVNDRFDLQARRPLLSEKAAQETA